MSLAFPIERPLTRAIGSSVRWGRRRSIWTPAALFAQGQQGVWYEPKPQYLYQDAAGTVPVTADGDPVGLMLDLSGNGNHATQETSAARPIYRTDGALHWLEFDGVDDRLLIPALSLYRNVGYGAIAVAYETASTSTQVSASWSGARSTTARLQILNNSTEVQVAGRRLDSDRYEYRAFSRPATGAEVFIGAADWKNARAIGYLNGDKVIDTRFQTAGLTSGTDSTVAVIGNQAQGANPGFPYSGKFSGMVAVNQEPDYQSLSSYLANLAGVTL